MSAGTDHVMAMEMLFGPGPAPTLSPVLADWVPPQALIAFAAGRGLDTWVFLNDGITEFCGDDRYFDEVVDAAKRSARHRRPRITAV